MYLQYQPLHGPGCGFLSMGYFAELPVMDSKRACFNGSTGNLTNQHIIQDHMLSHYKKIYSAKAVVDCAVPKSMCRNVKYIDQKRREQLKQSGSERAQSVRSVSQRSVRLNTMTSCSSKHTRPAVRGEEDAHFKLGGSQTSSQRFNTSFHFKQIAYASQNCRPASELSYKSPNSYWHHSMPSCSTSASQKKFKTFQDPTQKTYSGDIMLKHAHHFTEEKPFTPRTLKSDCKSTLSSYRFYTPASRKAEEEKTPSKFQDTYHGRTCRKQGSPVGHNSPHQYSPEHEWCDEESNVFGHTYSTANKYRESDFLLSSSRVSPEGMRSPIMKKVTSEEKEVMYLEFITDVTNEIVARGIYSDRVLERVFERHIEMNRHRLEQDKMRHLLDVLRNDLQSPLAAPVMALKEDKDSFLLPRHEYSSLEQQLTFMTTDYNMPLSSAHFDNNVTEKPIGAPSFYSPLVNSNVFENAGAFRQQDEEDQTSRQDLDVDHGNAVSTSLENHHIKPEDNHKNYILTADDDPQKELDELERKMTETLSMSETHGSQDCVEQDSTTLSDDEF